MFYTLEGNKICKEGYYGAVGLFLTLSCMLYFFQVTEHIIWRNFIQAVEMMWVVFIYGKGSPILSSW